MPSGAKNWCFTLNNPVLPDPEQLCTPTLPNDWAFLTYRIHQLERGAKDGTLHLQGFCSFSKRRSLVHCKKHLTTAHWEVAKGNAKSNYDYCTKSDTRVSPHIEYGTLNDAGSQGKRSDIALAVSRVLGDTTFNQAKFMEEFPGLFIRHPTFIGRVRSTREPVSRLAGVTCTLLLGPPGTGKSRYVYSKHPQAFRKPSGNWFDGYEGQDVILLEDFDSSTLDSQHLLTLLDRYPLSAPVKGSFLAIHASAFFITSNNEPQDWYPDEYARKRYLLRAIHRRITTVLNFIDKTDDGQLASSIEHWSGRRFFGPARHHQQPDQIELDPFSPSLTPVDVILGPNQELNRSEVHIITPPLYDPYQELFALDEATNGFRN